MHLLWLATGRGHQRWFDHRVLWWIIDLNEGPGPSSMKESDFARDDREGADMEARRAAVVVGGVDCSARLDLNRSVAIAAFAAAHSRRVSAA